MARKKQYVVFVDGVEKPEGYWLQPSRKGFRFCCCDCTKVHTLRFRLRSRHIEMSVREDRRRTAARRRAKALAGVSKAIKALRHGD
jgi:hypothetical protein